MTFVLVACLTAIAPARPKQYQALVQNSPRTGTHSPRGARSSGVRSLPAFLKRKGMCYNPRTAICPLICPTNQSTYVALIQTVYRALLTSAVSGIGHRMHTPKKKAETPRQLASCVLLELVSADTDEGCVYQCVQKRCRMCFAT